MKKPFQQSIILVIGIFLASVSARAVTLDTVVFGDSASESAHGLSAPQSQVITGGLGQLARKMLPDPADTTYGEGGYLNFTAACDPLAVNYVTLKIWGSDTTDTSSGNLLIYQIENGQLLQVGYRVVHFREMPPIAWVDREEQTIPDRFYYTTVPLPLSLTQGRNSLELRIVGSGMNTKGSLPVYRAYIHTGAFFQPSATDPQGNTPPPAPIRPPAAGSMQEAYLKAKATTIANMNSWLANNNGDLNQLIDGYNIPWTPAYQNPLIPPRVVTLIDNAAKGYFANPTQSQGWGGNWGPEGDIIAKIGATAFGSALDEVVDLGDAAGPATRRILWAKMLKASMDAGRYGRRGPTTNQTIINDKELYNAQRGLAALNSPDALPADQAMRYLLESVGLAPWLGPDRTDGTRNSFVGTNYYLVTPSGLTKEDGYVSAYGEVYDVSAGFYPTTGDERLKTRAVEMFRARSYFRYPMVDADGYRSFRMVGPLDWRTHQSFPFDQAYGERGTRLVVALATKDPYAIGYARQMFNDNQGGTFGTDLTSTLALETLVNEPDSGERLPMTEGQPDYAWCDVDNGIVAIKRGEELTWIEPYWQSRSGLHSLGRTFQMTPTMARVGIVRSDLQFTWNGNWAAKGNGPEWDLNTPITTLNGVVNQAYLGDKTLQAMAPDSAPGSTREEFIGRAAFYATRYGRYLVGINMDKTKSFELKTPAGFTSAQDLITKTLKSGTIMVSPVSCVVLDLGTTEDTAPFPTASKFITATGVSGGISVTWETAGGAVNYKILRSVSSGGPFTTLASGIGATYPKKWGAWPSGTYLDTTASPGTTYYYRIVGMNPAGEGYPSPTSMGATATANIPSVNALAAPWKNINFSGSGSASTNAGTFSLTGGGGDFWANSDGGHFVYQMLVGDGTLVARLNTVNNAYKVGLMIRGSLAANSTHAAIIRQGNVTALQRTSTGGGTGYFGTSATAPSPMWLKLERLGSRITFSWAPDDSGAAGPWTILGTSSPSMSTVAYVGLATTSGTPVFDHVTLTPLNSPIPAAPEGITAVPGDGKVTLSWLPASGAASYTVKRATASAGPYTNLANTLTAQTYTDTTATNGTTYYYLVSATNPNGTGNDSTWINATPSLTLPAPTNLTITPGGTQALLNWTPSSGATGYDVKRSVDGITWTTLASNITDTSYTDTGLMNGQSYLYTVVAVNGSGPGMTTLPMATVAAPTAPVLLDATGTGTSAILKWKAVPGAAGYTIKRSSSSGAPYTTLAAGVQNLSYSDSGLTNKTNYFYVVTASNTAGESNPSTEMKLGWGTGLLARYYNSNNFSGNPVFTRIDASIASNWGQGSPDGLINIDNFSIRWIGQFEAPTTGSHTFTSGGADDSFSMTINGLVVSKNQSLTTTLVAGQKYDITIDFGENSGAAYFHLGWTDGTGPLRDLPVSRLYPGSVISNRATGGTALANAQNSTDTATKAFDNSNSTKWNSGVNAATGWLQYKFATGVTFPVSEYRITSANDVQARDPKDWQFQGSQNGTTWVTLDTQLGQIFATRGLSKSYPIANTTAYTYYRLNITANNGGASNSIQLAELGLYSPNVLPVPPSSVSATPGSQQASINWSPVSGATSYLVKRSSYPNGPYTIVASGVSGTSYTDTGLANGATYYYVIAATSSVGSGENSAASSVQVAPAQIAPNAVTALAGRNQVTVSWAAIPGTDSYELLRSLVSGGPYATVASGLTATSHINTALTNGTTYYYVVRATYGVASSPFSSEVNATPRNEIAHYRFENNTQDSSGAGNHGSAGTGVSYTLSRDATQALALNGSNTSFVSIPRSISTDFSLSMWVKTTDSAGTTSDPWWRGKGLVDGEVSGAKADWGTTVTGGKFAFGIGSPDFTLKSTTSINNGQWHHLVATRESLSGQLKIYVDGVLEGTATGPTGALTAPPILRIGSLQTNANFLIGTMDDVILYDRTITPAEIAELSPPASPTSLSATGGNASITLNWSLTANATSYQVKRAPSSGGNYSLIASDITEPTYQNSGLADGSTYYYQVTAVNGAGESNPSNTADATTHTAIMNWRQYYFQTTAASGNTADDADPDGDGWNNADEFTAGTSPTSSGSVLKVSEMTPSGNAMILRFPTVAGRKYTLAWSLSLQPNSWQPLITDIPGTGGTIEVTDPDGANQGKRFYRVAVSP